MIELGYKQLKGEPPSTTTKGAATWAFSTTARWSPPTGFSPKSGRPKSLAAGLTLPQTVLLLQPVFQCWTGRCSTCKRPIDLAELTLHRPPKRE